MTSARTRFLCAAASTLVGLGLAYTLWSSRPEAASVALVDNRSGVDALLEQRWREGSARQSPLEDNELYREEIPGEHARELYSVLRPANTRTLPDPITGYWELSNKRYKRVFREHPKGMYSIRTNDHGFRKNVDVQIEQPDLRILVAGDSHTAGIVPNREQFGNLLQKLLEARNPKKSVEVLNGGKGGFQFYSYVGTLEKFLFLKPDVLVLAVYGGNNFVGSVSTFRYFNRMPPSPPRSASDEALWEQVCADHSALVAQDLNQVWSFRQSAEDVSIARAVGRQSTVTLQRLCEENGIELVLVYLPPVRDVQGRRLTDLLSPAVEALRLTPAELGITRQLANEYLAFAKERGIQVIDMRPVFKAEQVDCYWQTDIHLNTHGHALVAQELTEFFGGRED